MLRQIEPEAPSPRLANDPSSLILLRSLNQRINRRPRTATIIGRLVALHHARGEHLDLVSQLQRGSFYFLSLL